MDVWYDVTIPASSTLLSQASVILHKVIGRLWPALDVKIIELISGNGL